MQTLSTAMRYGALGLVADVFAPHITGRQGALGSFLLGLFRPSASDLDNAHEPKRTWSAASMSNRDFKRRTFTHRDTGNGAAYLTNGMKTLGAGMLFNRATQGFVYPKWLAAANNIAGGEYIPYTRGGYLASAWREGKIPSWGWLAGGFY